MEVEVDGRTVFAHTGGIDPDVGHGALVLLHGAGNDHSIWRYQTRRLAASGHPVLAVDLPGHGKSVGPALASIGEMAEWVLRLGDAIGAPTLTLVGHSMGSLIALETAIRRPRRVRGIALIATTDRMHVHPDLLGASQRRERLAADLIVGWSHAGPSRFGHHIDPGVWKAASNRRLLERHRDVLPVDLAACAAWSGTEEALQVETPALVIVSGHDRMTPARAGRALAELLPHSTLVEVPGGSHVSVYDHPAPVNDALLTWLERLPDRG